MEEKILAFEKEERQILSKDMPEKKISLVADETFVNCSALKGQSF